MFSTSCPKNFVNVTYNCGVLKCISGELRVEVDAVLHHHPVSTDSSSSSGYSSSSCSPRTPLCCDSTFDRTRDIHRRKFSNRMIESLQSDNPEKREVAGWVWNSLMHPLESGHIDSDIPHFIICLLFNSLSMYSHWCTKYRAWIHINMRWTDISLVSLLFKH